MEEKRIAILKMKNALKHLRDAWIECEYAFDNSYIDCNNYILGDKETEDEYPFHMSFDDMNTIGWIDGCLERIEDDLSK